MNNADDMNIELSNIYQKAVDVSEKHADGVNKSLPKVDLAAHSALRYGRGEERSQVHPSRLAQLRVNICQCQQHALCKFSANSPEFC
jgi:hypothetical protein